MKSSSIDLESGSCRLKLDDDDGRIISFTLDGEELIEETDQLFTLGFRDNSGDAEILSSNDFEVMTVERAGEGAVCLTFAEHEDYDELVCRVSIRSLGNSFFWKFDISGQDRKFLLEWFDCPQVVVSGRLAGRGGEGVIFQPIYEGILIDDPRLRVEKRDGWFAYKIMGYPNTGANGYYPGNAQMQFLAYYNKRAGLYFAAHDPTDCTKAVEVESLDLDRARLSLQTFCGQKDLEHYAAPFEFVLAGFKGNWMDAAEIYRNWALTDPHLPPRLIDNPRLPDWFDDSPVTLFVPVRGDGDDKGELAPNEYFPYVNIMSTVHSYAETLDSRIMTLLMHWEGTAPWAPPYVWPPFGGEDALRELRDQLHEQNHLLGVYCSGTAWTQTSSIVDYSQEKKCEEENLRSEMSRGPKNEIDAFICNGPKGAGQRQGFDCCIDREWTQQTVRDEIMKLSYFGIDYAQFFDQNLGGSAHFCYSRKHQHPPMPGVWQTEAMVRLCQSVENALAASGSKMLIGCEAAAAQPYIKYMMFSDLRNTGAYWVGAQPVPAYAYVFHEYINNFMGNQNGLDWAIDLPKAPENLLYRIAYAFHSGDMLALMLKDHGQVHWSWVMKWNKPAPDQDSIRTLVRNLNYWRQNEGKPYLVYGRMRKPLAKIECGRYALPSLISDDDLETDSVLSSSWQAPDGTQAQFLTNFRMEKQRVTLKPPAGAQVMVKRMDGAMLGRRGSFEMEIPPLSAVMVQLHFD